MTIASPSANALPHLFQSTLWGAIMTYHSGVQATMYPVHWRGKQLEVLVLHYPLPGGYWYAHIPRGPLGVEQDLSLFCAHLLRALPPKCVWIMLDPELSTHIPLTGSLRKGSKAVFPTSTLRIDLREPEESILAQMKEKGRYNIRLATKKGVCVSGYQYSEHGQLTCIMGEDIASDPLAAYGKLAGETTVRDGFRGHQTGFYDHFLRTLGKRGLLLLAHKDGVCLSGGLFAYDDTVFYYYYGASSNTLRELMAPYAVQWEAMRYAKSHTPCAWYDFLGIADDTSNAHDPLFGVSQFKCKFGGQKVWTGATYDYVCNPPVYAVLRIFRKIRAMLRR